MQSLPPPPTLYSNTEPSPAEPRIELTSKIASVIVDIQSSNLMRACHSLLATTTWLSTHVTELGFHLDASSETPAQLKLWESYNHAWLAMLQRQQDMMTAQAVMQPWQTVISLEDLKRLGEQLIRLADVLEPHGLVDYHNGVWEEQIMTHLVECCDQYEHE